MPSETAPSKVSLSAKPTESRWLAIADLPETATEETIKECFKRYGRVQSVKIDDQRFAFVAFLDVRMASKAHNSENFIDDKRLRTAFHDGSNSVPKALLEPSPQTTQTSSSSSTILPEQPLPINSTVSIEPTSSSSSNTSNVTTVTNPISTKTTNGDRDKRVSRTIGSPDENVRHQVVPVKRDSDSSGSKRKTSSAKNSKTANSSHSAIQKPPRRKHENSSSSSSSSSSSETERSSDDSVSCKNRRRNVTKTHSSLNDSMGKTRILKIHHLPSKTTKDSLRESLWNLFVEFKKSGRLLTVKIDGEHESRHALLTFRKSEDVDKALTFAINKSIGGVRLKAEPYDGVINENDECDVMKRSVCPDPDIDEYSVKATRTLYIGNLQSEISYNELRETYSAYGDIIELEIKRQTQSPHQLPFAFVQYADIKSVVKAMKAFESKLGRDHSIKLGFGKSQPTNVLWLDDLPSNITESSIRTFINRHTNLPTCDVVDIYIDNRNSHKSQTAQCLIYFTDTRAAQEAINAIRGKKLESKKIQVDFASKVFVTRFSDIIEETSHKKNYGGYLPDSATYHGESRPVSKRNGTAREIVPETIQTFDTASTRTNSSDRWPNAYNNNTRSQHKNDSRHSSDRRHSKEYGKGANSTLISIPSVDNGTVCGSSISSRRQRLSTSSKDSLSNNLSTGRNAPRGSHARHHASSSSSSTSRSSSTSSHSSTSTNSLERRSNSYQKHQTNKHSQKPSKKASKSLTNNNNNLKSSSGKKSSSNKEHPIKSSNRSRTLKTEKDNDSSTTIPAIQHQQQPNAAILPSLTLDDQLDSIKKESTPPPKQQQTAIIHSSSSPKAPLKNTERVFDWLMQNHLHDSNSSIGLDQNDDEEHSMKPKPDDDSLENVSDEQTSKTSPPIDANSTTKIPNIKLASSASAKNAKNEKAALTSAYRLQPIRAGNKRDEQNDNLSSNDVHLSPSHSLTTITKDDLDNHSSHRRMPKTKYHLSTSQTKPIPLESVSSYDQLDVRLRSYPSLFNDHVEQIRLPFPQFAFEHIKTSTAASNVLVVLNPKAHLKHSSLGLNNPSSSSSSSITNTTSTVTTTTTTKYDLPMDTSVNITSNNNEEDLSTARIPLDERIRLLDKQMYEMNHGQQKSVPSSSSSSSSSSLSPAILIEQQNLKTATTIAPSTSVNPSVAAKSVNDLVTTLSTSTPSTTLAQCIQAVRAAALNAQPTPTISPSKTTPTISTSSPFHYPVTPVHTLNINRTIPVPSPSAASLTVLPAPPPPPPPPPPPFTNLPRLPDPSSNSLLNTFHAAIAQTQLAAAKYTTMPFAGTLHPPPPPVPASLISPSLNLNTSSATSTLNTPSTNNLIPSLPIPHPPTTTSTSLPPSSSSSPSLPNRTTSVNLLSPPASNISSASPFSDSLINSPSTSSAKILERLGPSAKFKRKSIPPPLAVNSIPTTPTTPTPNKDSPISSSLDSTTPTNTSSNLHRSPGAISSPILQQQTSTGLKSILKQRSLSNPSPTSSLSPTNDRKSSTSYVSPLASNETRSTPQITTTSTTTSRSTSVDSTTKRTPPSTPTLPAEKKKSVNQQDTSVFTNDVDERQSDDKKSTWRSPVSKSTVSNETNNPKKPTLDKIPKKPSAVSKSTVNETAKPVPKVTKPTKPTTPVTPVNTKVPQLTIERVDTKSVKPTAVTSTTTTTTTGSSDKSANKSLKSKRTNIIQSDSETEKKPTTNDTKATKKSLLNNDITKRKQQHQQKSVPTKKNQIVKTKSKPTSTTVKKSTTSETHSSASDIDEKKVEQTVIHSDHEQRSTDNDENVKKTPVNKRTKTTHKNKSKTQQNLGNLRDFRTDTSMYDRIKKRARNEQTRNSSLSTSDSDLSDENSEDDDDDNDNDVDDDDEGEEDQIRSRRTNATPKRHNVMSDSSDSEVDKRTKNKSKTSTVFDNNIFDAEESDEPSKPINRKKKINQQQTQQLKKSTLKIKAEETKKGTPTKTNNEPATIANKKKITVTKTSDKKKVTQNSVKSTTKPTKTSVSTPKRPSTDESNESAKKIKLDNEKSKIDSIEEQTTSTITIQTEAAAPSLDKPSIILTTPSNETSTEEPKINEPSTEIKPQTAPTKFGIVFPSHRQSTTTTSPSTLFSRAQTTESLVNHGQSKNDDELMEHDHESVPTIRNNDDVTVKEEQTTSNTLKPPMITAQTALSDDETLNPETMQLSDLIGTNRREGTKTTQSRSTAKTTGKGKRGAKQETAASKRQQTKANSKTTQPTVKVENEREPMIVSVESVPVPSIEQPASISTATKRLSTAESSSTVPVIGDKETKRLRKSTDDTSSVKQDKVENISTKPNVEVKENTVQSTLVSDTVEKTTPSAEIPSQPQPTSDQPQVTSMETEQIPLSSSILTSTKSPSTTSAETELAIKALYPSIQIPQQSLSKASNLEKLSPIIAPISKETLPIVEHQPVPIAPACILPTHVPIKPSIMPTTYNESVEETLSAVNSLLMLNNNPSNISGDHPALKGAARVTPTISTPVYSLVASLPSPTDQQTRQTAVTTTAAATTTTTTTTTTTNTSTVPTQQNDLITMVSNIVSSSNLAGEKQPTKVPTPTPATITTTRSHIEEVIDDVAKNASSSSASSLTTAVTTAVITETTTSIVDTNPLPSSTTATVTTKSPSIPHVLRDVMKTPCLTSTTTGTTTTTATTIPSETLNIFEPHRRSKSPLKTTATTATSTNIPITTIASTTATSSTVPPIPVLGRQTLSNAPTSHKRSSTPKNEPPPLAPTPSAIMNPYPHMLTPDSNPIFAAAAAAAAAHQNFPYTLFNPMQTNPVGNTPSNLLTSPLVSSSPPLSTRTQSVNTSSSNTNSHTMNTSFLNTIMASQQTPSSTNTSSHTHEKPSKRDTTNTKNSGTVPSSSSSNRSTPIQQAVPVPVPIPLNIPPTSSSSSSSNITANSVLNQQQAQLLSTIDPVAMRQQASPLQQYLGPDSVVPFRAVYGEPPELYGAPPSLYPSPNMAYAAAQQMLNVMGITGSHHASAAALAELYSNPESFFRLNSAPNELSRDPYNVQWQGNLILKNDQAYVKTQLVAGSPSIARASMNYWNSDSLSAGSSSLQSPSHHNLRISQRMRLEQAQLEGVQKRMLMESDHCILIAEPNGSTPDEIRIQQNNLKNGVIRYFDEKKAAGIVNVLLPGASQPAYVVHIFPPCQFASEILQKRAPDTYRCVVQNKIEQIYLLIVITSTVQ